MDFDKIYTFLKLLVANIVSILFLLGLITVNIAVYIGYGTVIGLIVTGSFLIIIALIIDRESKERR
ncbi:hypothetical protein EF793_05135 [Staphylococcus pseudintermedius]|uniref:hypothetical protein n=1 Tax=Staphylococcus pseudintermedius TaxID=283734 RepID=UPI000C1C1C77|nr:hypothetical protein [Staphylococcus pseudintermedius]EGQ1710897.1 hypothetical protein [Staphylococcus pseudintermedius]EHT8224032.1 hypothetical protein [Staphylococcus pseudintermedius]MDK3727179.1 hypothetical protein [Staphylococcus pseudintermedius]MDT0914922.1 hypothetical protein [Staphylococcus pseudintermedius]MDT0979415.1 hypothetical protein [Staphylococcus pseudintermedius]